MNSMFSDKYAFRKLLALLLLLLVVLLYWNMRTLLEYLQLF